MVKYIVLDVDRTLVDSFKPELLSFGEALERVVGYKLTSEQEKVFTAMPTTVFLKHLNLSAEQIENIMKEWNNTFPKYKTVCFNGIKDAIRKLHNKGYDFGLITSRTLDEYHELDDELKDIRELFKSVITSDIVKTPKPNPQSMKCLCRELGCSSDEVIYIGDNKIDKEFAINSNCYFIPACYDNKELCKEENACFNPRELPEIVDRVIKKKHIK